MPLPKPPARKASLLAPADFEAQAAPKTPPRSTQSQAAAEPAAAVLDLFDSGAAVAAPPLAPSIARAAAAPLRAPVVAGQAAQATRQRPAQTVRARHQRVDA